jgi:hypothetical protein
VLTYGAGRERNGLEYQIDKQRVKGFSPSQDVFILKSHQDSAEE